MSMNHTLSESPACPETSPLHGQILHECCEPSVLLPLASSAMPSDHTEVGAASAMTDHKDQSSMATSIQITIPHSPLSVSDLDMDSDFFLDSASPIDMECLEARPVTFSRPTLVDIMRAEKPVFRRASRIILHRPLSRPVISPIQARRSSSASRPGTSNSDRSSYDSNDHSSRSSTPTTPSLDDDEGSTSMISDAPSSPVTPKSSFEQERQCFVPYKQEISSTPLVTILPDQTRKTRKPSRLRLLPRKSFILNTGSRSDVDFPKSNTQLPPTIIESGSRSATDVYNMDTPRPWSTQTDAQSVQSLDSPALSSNEPVTARLMPAKILWRDVPKPRFLKRMENRVGLNAAAVNMAVV